MITAVIAEKPSVAKDIANVLNVRERHDGYLSGNGYLVTWAFGHLVQLAMPEAYGYAGFRRENLPILPQEKSGCMSFSPFKTFFSRSNSCNPM